MRHPGGSQTDRGLRIQDCRHTWTSQGVMNGISLITVDRMLGHLDCETTANCAHLDDAALRDVAAQAASVIARAIIYTAAPPPLPDEEAKDAPARPPEFAGSDSPVSPSRLGTSLWLGTKSRSVETILKAPTRASKPMSAGAPLSASRAMAGSHPAAPAIWRNGSFRGRAKARRSGSADPAAPFSIAKDARASATPQPATTPSFAATRGVHRVLAGHVPRLPRGLGDAADPDVGDARDQPHEAGLVFAPVVALPLVLDGIANFRGATLHRLRHTAAAEDRARDPVHDRPPGRAERRTVDCRSPPTLSDAT